MNWKKVCKSKKSRWRESLWEPWFFNSWNLRSSASFVTCFSSSRWRTRRITYLALFASLCQLANSQFLWCFNRQTVKIFWISQVKGTLQWADSGLSRFLRTSAAILPATPRHVTAKNKRFKIFETASYSLASKALQLCKLASSSISCFPSLVSVYMFVSHRVNKTFGLALSDFPFGI